MRRIMNPNDSNGGRALAQRVRKIRKALRMSQAEFGEAVGLSQQAVSKIERGEQAHTRQLSGIARLAGLTLAELVDDSGAPILNDKERTLLDTFRQLGPADQAEILDLTAVKFMRMASKKRRTITRKQAAEILNN